MISTILGHFFPNGNSKRCKRINYTAGNPVLKWWWFKSGDVLNGCCGVMTSGTRLPKNVSHHLLKPKQIFFLYWETTKHSPKRGTKRSEKRGEAACYFTSLFWVFSGEFWGCWSEMFGILAVLKKNKSSTKT